MPEPYSWPLVCPRDKSDLQIEAKQAICRHGHRYGMVEDIPILLLSEMDQTHIEGSRSLAVAEAGETAQLPQFNVQPGEIDPFVKINIAATNGSLYQHLVGNLTEYPIPELRLPNGEGKKFLEIGCSWGRWCIAAARQGYQTVGIDPSLKGIRAARRVAGQIGVAAEYLVADGRGLPFPSGTFDWVFSYSVLQHLSKSNVASTLQEIRRVLRPGGGCLIQMPNVFGIRCLYHQTRRGFREAKEFEVRYWTIPELAKVFGNEIGPTRVSVDGYFSLNPQASDIHLFPFHYRTLVQTSEALRRISEKIPIFRYIADSLYVTSTRLD